MSKASATTDRVLPTRIGRYRVLAELGQGGMAVAYLARAGGLGGFERLFAIKMIHEHLCREPAFVSMFLNEARLVARIHHPNVIPVYEVDVDNGRYFLSLDYVSGETLAQTLWATLKAKKKLPPYTAIGIVAAVAEGLHAAHELRGLDGKLLGVVHRDVAPQNIMIGYDGIVRVMDFGVAKAQGQLHHSRPGTLKGTIAYMAPEQLRGAELDRRGDIFSLGVILWEAIACKRLFKAKSDLVTGSRILKMEVPRLTEIQPECPPGLEEIVARALARDPAQRYSTAQELSDALHGVLAKAGQRAAASDVERLMAETFPERRERRREMERMAAAPEPTGLFVVPPPISELGVAPEQDENFVGVIEVVEPGPVSLESADAEPEPAPMILPRHSQPAGRAGRALQDTSVGEASIARAIGWRPGKRSLVVAAGLVALATGLLFWGGSPRPSAPPVAVVEPVPRSVELPPRAEAAEVASPAVVPAAAVDRPGAAVEAVRAPVEAVRAPADAVPAVPTAPAKKAPPAARAPARTSAGRVAPHPDPAPKATPQPRSGRDSLLIESSDL